MKQWLTSHSLQGRLLRATLLTLPLFLSASGYLLDRAFQQSLRDAEAEQLQTQLYILLGATEFMDDQLWLPEQLPEPKFSTPDSDLFALISNDQQQMLWRSQSLEYYGLALPHDDRAIAMGKEFFDEIRSPATDSKDKFFRFRYDLVWVTETGQEQPMRFEIFHMTDSFRNELQSYRRQLLLSLLLLTAGLISVQLLITRWGLLPLQKLAREIDTLKNTDKQTLDGHYPEEIQPVTESLNEVLGSEQQQRERYKNTLGDLAHSLKTPLAVIQGELGTGSNTIDSTEQSEQVIQDQLQRMNAIIRHQLQRAVITTQNSLHNRVELKPIIDRLTGAMNKVYRDKHIEFDIQIASDFKVAADSQDLFECLGNLIENACKYGKDKVRIGAHNDINNACIIYIEDNGAGVPTEMQQTILQRGARVDTAKPGQGIGLSVATDIISAYGGSIECSQSKLGGAEFKLVLPHST